MNLYCSGRLLLLAVTGLSVFTAGSGMADVAPDAAGDRVIEEILVTARRREEASIAVPMSLTRIDGASIDGLQYQRTGPILKSQPRRVGIHRWRRVSSQITIRGVVTRARWSSRATRFTSMRCMSPACALSCPGSTISSRCRYWGPAGRSLRSQYYRRRGAHHHGASYRELSARIDASYAQYDTRKRALRSTFRVGGPAAESHRLVPGQRRRLLPGQDSR